MALSRLSIIDGRNSTDPPFRRASHACEAIGKVQLTLTAELGRARETIGQVMALGEQSLVELDKSVGDPVDLLLNGELFARGEALDLLVNGFPFAEGEVVVVQDQMALRITRLIDPAVT